MAWYHDKQKTTYVATYKDEKSMRREVEEAAKYGWTPQDTAATSGHINVGRTAARVALTGGVGLLFGASRSKDKVTITFIRNEASIARIRLDEATRQLDIRRASLTKARTDTERAVGNRDELLAQALASSDLNRESTEKDLRNALKNTVQARESMQKNESALLSALIELRDARAHAERAGERFPTEGNIGEEMTRIQSNQPSTSRLLNADRELLRLEEDIIKAASAWGDASGKVTKAVSKTAEVEGKLKDLARSAEDDDPRNQEKHQKRLREAEEERTKRHADQTRLQADLDARESHFQTVLEARAKFIRQLEAELPAAAADPVTQEFAAEAAVVASAADVSAAASANVFAQIEKLAELHRVGVLTEEEFAAKKADLLSRL